MTRCFEVLVPYYDRRESAAKGVPIDTRHAYVVQVWARDVDRAQGYAKERFRDHRIFHRTAAMAPEGPVALRVVRDAQPLV
jgi:hypothetical protein